MRKPCRWPSRRLQIALIIILAAAAAVRALMPPISRQARAEKLYTDSWYLYTNSWYVGLDIMGEDVNPRDKAMAVTMLEKALELDPGNTLYEQALVWQYPPERLPDLVNRPESLSLKARILAAHRIYLHQKAGILKADPPIGRSINPGKPGYSKQFSAEYWRESLHCIDALAAADPGNALPRCYRALVYGDMDRPSDMLAETKSANRMSRIILYRPDLPKKLSDSAVGFVVSNGVLSECRKLSDRLRDYGNGQLRRGNVSAAVDTLEQCCLMGVKMAMIESADAYDFHAAATVFNKGWRSLEPVLKDFGMHGKLRHYQRIAQVFRDADASFSMDYDLFAPGRPLMIYMPVIYAAGLSMIGLLLSLIVWGVMAFIRRRMMQEPLVIPAWREGWLARLFMLAYLSLTLILGYAVSSDPPFRDLQHYNSGIIGLVCGITGLIFSGDSFPGFFYSSYRILFMLAQAFTLTLIVQPLILITSWFALWRRYVEQTGESIRFVRFVFAVPSSVRAWRNRAFAAMFAGQLIFLLCCGFVITIVFKSAYDAHPWQPIRMRNDLMVRDHAAVKPYSDELRRLIAN